MKKALESKTKKMRKLLFTPLKTRSDLHAWIKLFFGLDLPDVIVDPDSTSTPMDAIWDSYNESQKAIPEYTRVLYYAARDAGKTLAQAIFECLSILHLRRDIIHLAAIESQSTKAQNYIKSFFGRPYLRDFVVGNNKREFQILRYYNPKTGDFLNEKEWGKLDSFEKNEYEEQKNQTIVIVATLKSTNSQHGNLMIDEVDLIDNPKVYEEAKMIPAVINKRLPITYITSSRKSGSGLVQKELDEAEKTGLKVGHWNILDVTTSCAPERHRPDLPKLTVFRSNETLRTLTEQQFQELSEKERSAYIKDEAYNGCINNCSIFAMCKKNLAHRQTGNSLMLKPIEHIQNLFAQVDIEVAKSQLLCLKPSSDGMIYSRLDDRLHLKTEDEIYEMITSERPEQKMSKRNLVDYLKSLDDAKFYVGMDFGFTHNFAVTLACVWGSKIFFIEAFEEKELELTEQINICNYKIKHYSPIIYADMAYPAYIKTFKRHGFNMRKWIKGHDSVIGGIEIVRQKIMSSLGEPEMFFLKGDEGCEELFKELKQYKWETDDQGNPTEKPVKINDDLCDAMRYLIMNVFNTKNRIATAHEANVRAEQTNNHADWMRKLIDEALGENEDLTIDTEAEGNKGKLRWSF